MEMHQVRYFLAVARTLNFTRAAEECNVSQPSLTRAIQALEAELGGELIRRERTHSHLTELGTRMLPLLQQCYDSATAAKTVAQSVKRGETSPLSVGISCAVSEAVLTAPLRSLVDRFKGVQLRLKRGTPAEISASLKAGEIEIAVAGPLAEDWDRVDAYPLYEEPFDLFVSREHRLAKNGTVAFADLRDERLLVDVSCEMADTVMAALNDMGIDCDAAHQVTTDHDLMALLEANIGIAVIPAGTI
ncbi:MAG: LysR family transcriptional regulator [Alphaproteobacteria bacterium]|nr:LysR family transcriptional regulator [Alphaproteobacteria bacterium]